MYQVGQILYIILKKKKAVFPVQVVEQVVRKTLTGEDVTFKVTFPTANEPINLQMIAEKVFTSPEDLQTYLMSNLSEKITAMVNEAIDLASSSFAAPAQELDSLVTNNPKDTSETMQITLEDGTKANVTVPSKIH